MTLTPENSLLEPPPVSLGCATSSEWRLYLDVDGPLNAFGRTVFPTWDDLQVADVAGYNIRHSKKMGQQILALAEAFNIEIVWASTWCRMDDINRLIGSLFDWPTFRKIPYIDTHPRGCGKLTEVARDAESCRGVVWIDDDLWGPDLEWAERRHEAGFPTFTVKADPGTGITPGDLSDIAAFVARN